MKRTCPICKKATPWDGNPWRPFCSERCKLIDLGKWAMGDYRVPGEKAEPTDKVGEIEKESYTEIEREKS